MKDPTETAKEWKRTIVREQRTLDRDVNRIKREEQKAMVTFKDAIRVFICLLYQNC